MWASIKDIVNEGLVIAIREDRDTVTYTDVVKAKQLKQHGLPDEHEYIERERHSVAVHEACHAVIAYRERKHLSIDLASPRRSGVMISSAPIAGIDDSYPRFARIISSGVIPFARQDATTAPAEVPT